ncbi:proprotein convertase subtilisin/kexin type 4-like [Cyprinodon tularosa]|uniref:proprotein convertase subtilisin/kexin type 4-like n=1 Tax=Cyprinodon tularosa TaxID=77115 RepID=UPI0018E22CB9|nr:proprotein convertase subtilisin/kexin type 4-like [Cyprinodon tularosa]
MRKKEMREQPNGSLFQYVEVRGRGRFKPVGCRESQTLKPQRLKNWQEIRSKQMKEGRIIQRAKPKLVSKRFTGVPARRSEIRRVTEGKTCSVSGSSSKFGVDHTNLDLKKNFEALASYDLRASHGLSHDPMPVRDEENSHGTRCAGEIAMEANNSYCGVGIAFNARIGGIRLLDGTVTDAMEASALTYNMHFIDIYVCSWGPRDNGAEMDGPHRLTAQALRLGTHKGRQGKGNIFVWASGNGGMQQDHCGADGYVNSIYTIAIGAITQAGKPAYFGESCPGVIAVTLTGASNGISLPLVTVTNMGDGCVTRFPGTSSAAPIAAGILALALEVNPLLTWRDVQHLIAMTAKIPDPEELGWTINAAGYHVHHRYGFGVLDAGLMVQQAARFHRAAPQRKCKQEVTFKSPRLFSARGQVSINIESDACQGTANEVNTLEHVQVRVSLTAPCRGDLSISLESPGGTVSLLLDTRPNDDSAAGLKNWTLMTLHCWGEQPRGLWTLKVSDHTGTVWDCTRQSEEKVQRALHSITLILYGTHLPQKQGPLDSIVSMGGHHPIPHGGLYKRDGFPPLDLLQWVYQMERNRKVRAGDIALPAKHKTLGTTRDRMTNMTFIKHQTSRKALKLQPADVLQMSSLRRRPVPKMKEMERQSRSLSSQIVKDFTLKKEKLLDSSNPLGEAEKQEGDGGVGGS